MPTRPLHHPRPGSGRLPSGAQLLHSLTRTPTPPFHLAFPQPEGYGLAHPLYEARQAANRIYMSRKQLYREKGLELNAPALMAFVRKDVLGQLLEEETGTLGPVRYARYRWLDGTKYWAWLPAHRERAEALYDAFKKSLKPKRI